MAGGVKKPVNIFRLRDLGEPKEVFNWRLWFAVFSFGLLGAARGVDEGLISGAFNSRHFQGTINYSSYTKFEQANIKANVSSMVQLGSVGGALIAFLICYRIGRIWATRQLCLLWVFGIAIFMGANGNLSAMYAGRSIVGLGVGQTPVVGPVYIAEIAPASVRVNLGNTTAARWEVPTSLHVIFAAWIFILSLFQYESPRYLIKKDQHDKAAQVMARLRNLPPGHDYVTQEIDAITSSHREEMEATAGSGWLGVLKEAFTVPTNLYRVCLSICAQVLSQWSGAGSITLYAPDLFTILGITGTDRALLVTAVFGIVKLTVAVLCVLFLVDFIGRKRSLLIGITFQAVSMIYVAAFLTAVPDLGTQEDFILSPSQLGLSKGAIAMIYISGFGWALGWNSMQYLLTAELFPLRIRASLPNMLLLTELGGISPKGTFWSFAVVTILGGVWVFFMVPETAGQSLEIMNLLYGNRNTDMSDLNSPHIDEEKVVIAGTAVLDEVEKK
ncbi:general substrate transporter [Triangularia setosa]|uniref:General substrate transporter n=1 Tax=Triangularia setosa TaxID=2587417 RepID=A0AAN7A9C7_9PEZI|nr:general substrate transporter [Podospora setosa]